jgi:hypothetical protein
MRGSDEDRRSIVSGERWSSLPSERESLRANFQLLDFVSSRLQSGYHMSNREK